ncbi:unnamed protein product [Coccothraustes coccothraustes]
MAELTPGMLRGLGTRRLPSASGNRAKSSGQSPQEWSGSFKRRPTFDLQSSFWPSEEGCKKCQCHIQTCRELSYSFIQSEWVKRIPLGKKNVCT